MAHVEVGTGPAIVFLHGNPTSSHLWRHVIPHVADLGRCLAPDLIGFGDSDAVPGEGDARYHFARHAEWLEAWFDAVVPDGPVSLVLHDWGSALGFDWACRHEDRVDSIAYLEGIVRPLLWSEWPEAARGIFEAFRSPVGEELVLDRNLFVETVLPAGDPPFLDPAAMREYLRPFSEPGERRRPTLTWPRMIPLDGEPAEVVEIVERYAAWLQDPRSPSKLLVRADPGAILIGAQLDFARSFANQTEVHVEGGHFVPEHSPHELGEHIREFLRRCRA